MSDTTSDGGINIALSVPRLCKREQDPAVPGLAELSKKDESWDIHRANADRVAACYSAGGQEFKRYADRISFCSLLLDFRLVPEVSEYVFDATYKLKLAAVLCCRVRTCTVCTWRRSLVWKVKASEAIPKVIADYPNARWLFLTLTAKNCKITELRETLSYLNKSFKRLTELKAWLGKGWIKTVEVTKGKDGKSAHPHLHVLIMVSSSYFSGRDYLSQKRWVELWQKCLRVDYEPVLDIKALKADDSLSGLLTEVIKYQTKPSDLLAGDTEWFLEYTRQVYKTRAISVGGVLRDYFKGLEKEPENFVGDDGLAEIDEGHLYFSWRSKEGKYKLNS